MPPPDGDFQQTGEAELYDGSFLRFVKGEFVDPNGHRFEREVVRHPGAVCVVPLQDDGSIVMVRQYRAPVNRSLLEVPAGKLDVPGEAPDICARRELIEEAGRAAGNLVLLGSFYNSPGFNDEHTLCYLAENLEEVARDAQDHEEQFMTTELVQLHEVWPLVERGELIDAKSIIACALAERYVGRRSRNR
jgi:ADP-ribose pyrophosphatase